MMRRAAAARAGTGPLPARTLAAALRAGHDDHPVGPVDDHGPRAPVGRPGGGAEDVTCTRTRGACRPRRGLQDLGGTMNPDEAAISAMIDRLAGRSPVLVALAEALSLAARVEPQLVRDAHRTVPAPTPAWRRTSGSRHWSRRPARWASCSTRRCGACCKGGSRPAAGRCGRASAQVGVPRITQAWLVVKRLHRDAPPAVRRGARDVPRAARGRRGGGEGARGAAAGGGGGGAGRGLARWGAGSGAAVAAGGNAAGRRARLLDAAAAAVTRGPRPARHEPPRPPTSPRGPTFPGGSPPARERRPSPSDGWTTGWRSSTPRPTATTSSSPSHPAPCSSWRSGGTTNAGPSRLTLRLLAPARRRP